MKNQTSIKETIEEIFKFIAKFRLMNQASIRIKTAAFIATILGCFFYNISIAQYSLRPRITEFLTDEQDFRKNEMLRSQEYQGKNNNLFLELLRKENELRNLYKDFTFKFNDREYRYEHTIKLIDTIIMYSQHNKEVLSKSKTNIDNIIREFENSYVFKTRIKRDKEKITNPDSISFNEYISYIYETIDLIPQINQKIIAIFYLNNKIRYYTNDPRHLAYQLLNNYIANRSNIQQRIIFGFRNRNSISNEKIELLHLIGDLALKYNYGIEDILSDYLNAFDEAWFSKSSSLLALSEFKISDLYNPHINILFLDKSLDHVERAIQFCEKGDCHDSLLYNKMLARIINLKCMKFSKIGSGLHKGDWAFSLLMPELYDLKDAIWLKDLESKYLYYQSLGHYFSSTGIREDLFIAKYYYQISFLISCSYIEKQGQSFPDTKEAIYDLLWVYSNLNLYDSALDLFDQAYGFAEKILGKSYTHDLRIYKSYMYYTLHQDYAAFEQLKNAISQIEGENHSVNWKLVSDLYSLMQFSPLVEDYFDGEYRKWLLDPYEQAYHLQKIFSELTKREDYNSILRSERELKKIKESKKNVIYLTGFVIFLGLLVLLFLIKRGNWLKNKNKLLEQKVYISDLLAAVSQVLARCMSHNIGSHALSKFMDKDSLVRNESERQYKSDFNSFSHQSTTKIKRKIELIGNFNEYLKYRMDFLADIATTSQPFMETPMYFASNLFKGFDKNRILLNRISGVSSDITYQFKLLINDKEIYSVEKDGNDKMISIPNDVLGAQAFYIILENIIRNIYKHGNPTKIVVIEIHLNEVEKDKSLYQVSVFDNLFKPKDAIDSLVISRNEAFDEDVLLSEENHRLKNKLRSTNLGTIEMAVCAAYLKGLPVTSIEEPEEKLNFGKEIVPDDSYQPSDPNSKIIYAYTHCHGEKKYSLGYRYYLNKPKQMLIVSDDDFSFESKEDLDTLGIKIISPKELETKAHFNHQFICFANPADISLINDSNRSLLPKRIVFLNESVNTNSANEFLASIWKQHLLGLAKGYSGASIVYSRDKREISWTNQQRILKTYIDNHHGNWNLFYGSRNKEYVEDLQFLYENGHNLKEFDYYEIGCSHSTIMKYYSKMLFSKKELILPYEYLECVFLRVMILDERIQESIMFEPKKMYASTVPFDEYFKLQHIFIPGKDDANLHADGFGDYEDVDSEYSRLIKYINQGIDDVHFCVIHLGLIERMCPSGKDKTKKEIERVIGKLFPKVETRRKIIITSGRGSALNISDELSFIPLPMLENVLLTQHDKVALTKLLFNSRKFK